MRQVLGADTALAAASPAVGSGVAGCLDGYTTPISSRDDYRACSDVINNPNGPNPGNGCGPANNAILYWMTQYIPRYTRTVFDAHCRRHDDCYGTCNSDRLQCDQQLLTEAVEGCRTAWRKGQVPLADCFVWAYRMKLAVNAWGGSAWEDAQMGGACVCCHQPTSYYCNCNATYYSDLNQCLSECHVTTGCFTSICSPASS
jgi:hypothetical protein